MMDFDTFIKIVDEGSTPVLLVMAYFMYKIERALVQHFTETKAKQSDRDEKLDNIHNDVNAVIRRLAGMNGSNNQ